jgi:hypothetical protein
MYLTQKVLVVHPSSSVVTHMGQRHLAYEHHLLLLLLKLRMILYSTAHVCTVLLNPEVNVHCAYMYVSNGTWT